MNKRIFTFLILLLLTGCSNVEGFIVDKDEGKILVVSNNPNNPDSSKHRAEDYPAVWISTNEKKYELGQKVKAYYDSIEESYPGQTTSHRIKILKSTKPSNADLSVQEVIQVLLNENDDLQIPVIKELTYQDNEDHWEITVMNNDEELYFLIEDK